MQKNTIGIIYLIISSFSFSLQGIIAKFAFAEDISVSTLQSMRLILALPLFLFYARMTLKKESALSVPKKTIIAASLAGIMGFYIEPTSCLTSLHYIDAGIERVLLYTYPLFIILGSFFITKILPERKHLLALFVIPTGVFLIGGLTEKSVNIDPMGIGLALFGALNMAGYVLIFQAHRSIGAIRFLVYAMTAGTCIVLIAFFAQHSLSEWVLTPAGYGIIILYVIFGTLLPEICMVQGFHYLGAVRGACIFTLCPVITLVLGYIILDEVLSIKQVLGAALIVSYLLALELSSLFLHKKEQKMLEKI